MRIADCSKRVRAFLDGVAVVDSLRSKLVWADRPYPAYWFPREDVQIDLIADAVSERDDLPELVHVDWDAMDAWFEEDEEVYVHPRSPYSRVDILASSRHVRVEINGVTVADSTQPRILFETGLPPRYYLPLTDVRMDLLRPSARVTRCPYKGTATYWSVEAGDEVAEHVVWTYRTPLPESQKIAGLVAFFNERVDLYVDGVLQERPVTPFS